MPSIRSDGEHDAELVGERRQPVVPVGQHDDLPVVAHLEQLLGAAVHVADDRLRGHDALAVEHEPQPQHAVRGRVLRPDVEHHVLGGEPVRSTRSAPAPRPTVRSVRWVPGLFTGLSLPSLAAHRQGAPSSVGCMSPTEPFDPPGEPWVRVSPKLATLRRLLTVVVGSSWSRCSPSSGGSSPPGWPRSSWRWGCSPSAGAG